MSDEEQPKNPMKDLPIPLIKSNIQWKLYVSSPVKIYAGYDQESNTCYAATEGPPFFTFIPGTSAEVMTQIDTVITLYKKHMEEKNEKIDSKDGTGSKKTDS